MPLIVPANEQGAGFMAAGYARASGRSACAVVTSGPGRHEHGDAGARLHGGLHADRRDLRPGADRRDRHRRVPGSAGRQHHGLGRQARLPRHRPERSSKRRVRTAFEIARTGRPGPVVIDVPKDVQNWQGDVPGRRPAADARLPPAHARPAIDNALDEHALQRVLRDARRSRAAADLRRRRRDQRRRRRGAARVRRSSSASRWSRR